MKKIIYIIIFYLFVYSLPGNTQAITTPVQYENISINLFTIQNKDGIHKAGKSVNRILNDRINSAGFFDMTEKNKAQKSVTGSITTIKYKQLVKETDYVTRTVYSYKLVISIKATDTKSGKVELNFNETTSKSDNENKLVNEATQITEKIAREIIDYYRTRRPEKIIIIPEKVTPKPKDDSFHIKITGMSFAAGFILPVDSYADNSNYGLNLLTGLDLQTSIWDRIVFTPELVLFTMLDIPESIQSIYGASLSLQTGYIFTINNQFSIRPSIGLGYIFQWVDGDEDGNNTMNQYDYTLNFYYNPIFSINCTAYYAISEHYSLFLMPSYRLFFGKNVSTASFFMINLGFTKRY